MSYRKAHPENVSQEESMTQNPSASLDYRTSTEPPPTYSEAMCSSSYRLPAIQSRPEPTMVPYPVTNNSMPLPVTETTTAPYPIEENLMPSIVPLAPTLSDYDLPQQLQPQIGFSNASSSRCLDQPTTRQPVAYNHENLNLRSYIVLQNEQVRKRNDCSYICWMFCCCCCMETCRCTLGCLKLTADSMEVCSSCD